MVSHTLKVCLTGAECTGKTTLAEALALSYQSPLVPEVARSYLTRKYSRTCAASEVPCADTGGVSMSVDAQAYDREDVLRIAQKQMRREQIALAAAPSLIICDTDLLVLRVWWEVKFGVLPQELAQALAKAAPSAYLLTKPDIPWVPDPLRESGGDRDGLHRRHQRVVAASGCPYAELGGDLRSRLNAAKGHIDRWLAGG